MKIKIPASMPQTKRLTQFEIIVTTLVMIEPILSIPQIVKIFTTQSAGDYVLLPWLGGFIVNVTWLVYGISVKKAPVIISGVVWMLIHLSMMLGIILYG
jgi:uncharacterized protein with PQ loop repeat